MLFHRQCSTTIALVTALAIVVHCSPAVAEGGKRGDEARVARTKATVALNLGRYDEAAANFEEAYTLTQDPLLLFSLGQAYRLAGKPDKALAAFNSFLRSAGSSAGNSPKARAQIEKTATEIELLASTRFRPSASSKMPGDDSHPHPQATSPSAPALEPESVEPPPIATAPVKEPESSAPPKVAVMTPALEAGKSPGLDLNLSQTMSSPAADGRKPIYKKWWFWSSVAGALAVGGVATWYLTRSSTQQPGTTFGGVRVLP